MNELQNTTIQIDSVNGVDVLFIRYKTGPSVGIHLSEEGLREISSAMEFAYQEFQLREESVTPVVILAAEKIPNRFVRKNWCENVD